MGSGRGMFFGAIFPSPSTDLYPSWYKPNKGATGSQVIDKVSGKLATSCTPDAAKETVYNGNPNSFSIDEFVNGGIKSKTVTGNDDVHNCGDAPPTITLTAPDVCNDSCTITATASQGTDPLSSSQFPGTVEIDVGGKKVKTFTVSSSPSTVSFQYSPTSSGSQQVTAIVTDSVLYQGSDSKTVDFTAGVAGGNKAITNFQATDDGTNTTFSWSGGKGPFTIYDSDTGFSFQCSSSNTCQHNDNQIGSGDSVSITDSRGNSAPTTVQ